MIYHYISYQTLQEAENAQRLARVSFCVSLDCIQGASALAGDLYLGGKFWYVFHTYESLSFYQVEGFVTAVPSCGHALNVTHPYW